MKEPNIAIVHEWFVDYSGSEKVVEQLINLYPQASLFSLIEFLPENLKWFIKNKKVNTSFIQKLPFAKTKYRNYLPFMPLAIEQLDVSEADIVISSSHAVAKGVITNSNQLHICYCHSPIRYAWDLYQQYLYDSNLKRGFKGMIAKLVLHYIRLWDFTTSNRVDHFIANSNYIAKRIKKVYNREATVIYPPVDIEKFELRENKEDFYLTASRLVPYKKMDLIVEAFSKMADKKLVVIGEGPELKKIKLLAGKNVTILGFQDKNILKDYMQRAKAFVFAADEDFGITPVEAQACGTPVIAFRKGGNLETVVENETGVFFDEQNVESIKRAVQLFEQRQLDFLPTIIRRNAEKFSVERFQREFKEFVLDKSKI